MKAVVLRIDEAAAGAPFPVRLFVDDGNAGWWNRNPAVASAEIAADLSVSPPVLQPDGATPVDAQYCRDLVRNTRDPSLGFERAGQYLGRLLLPGGVAAAWRGLSGLDAPPGAPTVPVRTVLDIRPRELRALPWELVCVDYRRPFIDGGRPLVRGTVDWKASPPSIDWPVRVLVVIGARVKDDDVDWQSELDGVQDALWSLRHLVDHEVLRQPTRQQLLDAYTNFRPHVFHFIGHGRVDGDEGVLVLYDRAGVEDRPWRASDILATLSVEPPRLAIINACRSAGGAEPQDPFLVASAFHAARSMAVIGMQGDIKGRAAAACAKAFYAAFAGGDPVDVALAHARRAITAEFPFDTRDWALPMLALSVPPEQVLPITVADVTARERERITQTFDAEAVRDSVDRAVERRRLWRTVATRQEVTRHLLVLYGTEDIGKTDLVQWLIEGCALRGHRIAYVALDKKKHFDCLDVIRFIKKGQPESASVVRQPLPPLAFARLNRDLNLLLSDQPVPREAPAGQVDDDGLPLRPGDEHLLARIFEAFRAGLVEVAGNRSLILVLDEADRVESAHFKFLVSHLWRPIAEGELPGVRMIVAMRGEFSEEQGRKVLTAAGADVLPVELVDRSLFEYAARQFLRHHQAGPEIQKLVDEMAKREGPWSPGLFGPLRAMMKFLR